MKFQRGDRVIVLEGAHRSFVGKKGTVIGFVNLLYEIEFDEEITYKWETKKTWTGRGTSAVLESVYNSPLFQALK